MLFEVECGGCLAGEPAAAAVRHLAGGSGTCVQLEPPQSHTDVTFRDVHAYTQGMLLSREARQQQQATWGMAVGTAAIACAHLKGAPAAAAPALPSHATAPAARTAGKRSAKHVAWCENVPRGWADAVRCAGGTTATTAWARTLAAAHRTPWRKLAAHQLHGLHCPASRPNQTLTEPSFPCRQKSASKNHLGGVLHGLQELAARQLHGLLEALHGGLVCIGSGRKTTTNERQASMCRGAVLRSEPRVTSSA